MSMCFSEGVLLMLLMKILMTVLAAVMASKLWYETQWAARWGQGEYKRGHFHTPLDGAWGKLPGGQIWTHLTKPCFLGKDVAI